MDKYEFNIKIEQIKKLVDRKDFKTASEIADGIDWRRVRSVNLLTIVSSVYENIGDYDAATDILTMAYNRSSVGKRLIYKLVELSIKRGDIKHAKRYAEEFEESAAGDNMIYLVRYMVSRAMGMPLEKQIACLEAYKNIDFDEKWGYELAERYVEAGMSDMAISLCDSIFLWFGVGEYVDLALKLKMKHGRLTEEQEAFFDKGIKKSEYAGNNKEEYGDKDKYSDKLGTDDIYYDLKTNINEDNNIAKADIYKKQFEYSDSQNDNVLLNINFRENANTVDIETEVAQILETSSEKLADEVTAITNDGDKTAEQSDIKFLDENLNEETKNMLEEIVTTKGKLNPNKVDEVVGKINHILESSQAALMDVGNIVEILDSEENGINAEEIESLHEDIKTDEETLIKEDVENENLNDISEMISSEEEKTEEVVEAIVEEYEEEMETSNIDEYQNAIDKIVEETIPQEPYYAPVMGIEDEVEAGSASKGTDTEVENTADIDNFINNDTVHTEELEKNSTNEDLKEMPKELVRHIFVRGDNSSENVKEATKVLKEIHQELGIDVKQVAKIEAKKLNEKGLIDSLRYLADRDLVILFASQLSSTVLDELWSVMDSEEVDNIFVLVDTPMEIRTFCEKNPDIAQYFITTIGESPEMDLKAFTAYAVDFASEVDCVIDDMGMLALYAKAEDHMADGYPMTEEAAEQLIIEAADFAAKKTLVKLIKGIFVTRYDENDMLILKEEHFKIVE